MTNETKHTPGPWIVEDEAEIWGGQQVLAVVDGEGDEVAAAIYWPAVAEIGGKAESWKNAHLIAAAPELLAALERLDWEMNERVLSYEGLHNIIRAAILKARGEAGP